MASARKPSSAMRQSKACIIACAKGAQSKVPREPAAETIPTASPRRAGETLRVVALSAVAKAVQESATPMPTPAPRIRVSSEPPQIISASEPT